MNFLMFIYSVSALRDYISPYYLICFSSSQWIVPVKGFIIDLKEGILILNFSICMQMLNLSRSRNSQGLTNLCLQEVIYHCMCFIIWDLFCKRLSKLGISLLYTLKHRDRFVSFSSSINLYPSKQQFVSAATIYVTELLWLQL